MIVFLTVFILCLVLGIAVSFSNVEANKSKQENCTPKTQQNVIESDPYNFGTINTSKSLRSQKLKEAYIKQQADNLKKPLQPSAYKAPDHTPTYESKKVEVDTSYTDWLVTAAVINAVITDCSCHDGGHC